MHGRRNSWYLGAYVRYARNVEDVSPMLSRCPMLDRFHRFPFFLTGPSKVEPSSPSTLNQLRGWLRSCIRCVFYYLVCMWSMRSDCRLAIAVAIDIVIAVVAVGEPSCVYDSDSVHQVIVHFTHSYDWSYCAAIGVHKKSFAGWKRKIHIFSIQKCTREGTSMAWFRVRAR